MWIKEVFELLSSWNLVRACLRLYSLLNPHYFILVNRCPSIFRRQTSLSLLFFNVLGYFPVLFIHACVVNHSVFLGSLLILILAWFVFIYFISRKVLRISVFSSISFGSLLSLQHSLVLVSLCLPSLLQSPIVRYFFFFLRKTFVQSLLLFLLFPFHSCSFFSESSFFLNLLFFFKQFRIVGYRIFSIFHSLLLWREWPLTSIVDLNFSTCYSSVFLLRGHVATLLVAWILVLLVSIIDDLNLSTSHCGVFFLWTHVAPFTLSSSFGYSCHLFIFDDLLLWRKLFLLRCFFRSHLSHKLILLLLGLHLLRCPLDTIFFVFFLLFSNCILNLFDCFLLWSSFVSFLRIFGFSLPLSHQGILLGFYRFLLWGQFLLIGAFLTVFLLWGFLALLITSKRLNRI